MKKIIKLTSLLTFFSSSLTYALNVEDLQVQELGAIHAWQVFRGSSVALSPSVALRLSYVGSSTEAYVSITDGHIRSFAPANIADTADFGVAASSYSIRMSTTDTMGEICDVIDGQADYKCELVAAKRSDPSRWMRNYEAPLISVSSADLKTGDGYEVLFDTQTDDNNNANKLYAVWFQSWGRTPSSTKFIRLKECRANTFGSVGQRLRVFGKLRIYDGIEDGVERRDEVVFDTTVSSNATSTATWDASGFGGIDFAKGAQVVVRAGSLFETDLGETDFDTDANFISCHWEERSP